MIRRLRWKIVAINMAMVTALLLAVLGGVLLSSRASLEQEAQRQLEQALQGGPMESTLPGG